MANLLSLKACSKVHSTLMGTNTSAPIKESLYYVMIFMLGPEGGGGYDPRNPPVSATAPLCENTVTRVVLMCTS